MAVSAEEGGSAVKTQSSRTSSRRAHAELTHELTHELTQSSRTSSRRAHEELTKSSRRAHAELTQSSRRHARRRNRISCVRGRWVHRVDGVEWWCSAPCSQHRRSQGEVRGAPRRKGRVYLDTAHATRDVSARVVRRAVASDCERRRGVERQEPFPRHRRDCTSPALSGVSPTSLHQQPSGSNTCYVGLIYRVCRRRHIKCKHAPPAL